MKICLNPLLCLAVVLVSQNAAAADGDGVFVRAEIGDSFINTVVSENHELTYTVRAGYFLNDHVAIEGSYSNLGEHGSSGIDVKHSSYGIGIVGKKNFGSHAHTGAFIDGRLGIARNSITTGGVVGGDALIDFKSEDNTPYLGIGVGYDFNRNLGASLNILHQHGVETPSISIDYSTVTLGVEYRF